MPECATCGITGSGAFLIEVSGETYCEDHAPAEPCERCGAETESRTMTGAPRCERCQGMTSKPQRTDHNQAGLGEW